MKNIKLLLVAVAVAAVMISCEKDPDPNTITLDSTEILVDSVMFWYQSSMGGDPYIRLITSVTGQDNPDLLKLYPNKGLNELEGTYTWDADEKPAGTYDVGYTANYAGMEYEWTAIGKTGSGELVITKLDDGGYEVTVDAVLSVGSYDWTTGEFTEESTKDISVYYYGEITAL